MDATELLDHHNSVEAGNAMEDLTANLPDELLCQVLNFFSLSQKLRLESVNSKFKRCVRAALSSKPQTLKIDLTKGILNGRKVMAEKYAIVLHNFCQKAKFDRVVISIPPGTMAERLEQMDEILPILFFSNNNSLSPVKTLEFNAAGSPAQLHKTIDKCAKLKTVKFNFQLRPLNQMHDAAFFVDLHTALKNKTLTEVKLTLYKYSTKDVIDAFGSLAPNTLQKLDLTFIEMPSLALGQLVSELSCNAWTALQEINFGIITVAQLNQLASSKTHTKLPLLQKCNVQLQSLQRDQFVATLSSLFASNLPIAVGCLARMVKKTGCSITNQVHQLQKVHRELRVEFSFGSVFGSSSDQTFFVGNASFKEPFSNYVVACNPVCIGCHSFYPIVVDVIGKTVCRIGNNRLQICKLDRCRVGNVVNDLNFRIRLRQLTVEWEAVSATFNEARDQVTITFEACPGVVRLNPDGTEQNKKERNQCHLNVACGHCIRTVCMAFLPIY